MHELDLDLYADAAILDPYPLYRRIRNAAPAVYLPAHDCWAIGRYADVRAALRADEVLVSGSGIALNDIVNGQPAITTLTSDGALHRRRRGVLMRPMMPSALATIREDIERLAEELVEELCGRTEFDGIADFARHLPVSVVSRLVGLPEAGRARMLEWAAATFDLIGPFNARAEAAVEPFLEMAGYAQGLSADEVRADGWARLLFAALEAGELEAGEELGLQIDYIAPSLDTTILGTGHMLYQLGLHPEQWQRLRREPERIPAAVHESLRLEAPVRAFTRLAAADYDCSGCTIPRGARVLILYGSANRDERHYPDPDRFDITREAREHLAFGFGPHRCAGGYLAQLEMEALLRAMVPRVNRIEVGRPEPLLNNVLRGWKAFPVRFL